MVNPRGRPPAEEPRDKNVLIRLTRAEHELVTQAADADKVSISSLGRDELVRGSKRRLRNASREQGKQ